MIIKLAILFIFLAIMVAIGIYCRNKSSSISEFVLGGRNLGAWFTAFAYGTSYFSAVVFIGYAGQFGWNFGMAATWIGIGNAVIGSMLVWLVLGERTRVMTKHLSATTMPEFFERRYNSKRLKTVASLIVFIFLIPYTASVYNGLSRLFEMAFNIPYTYCIIGMAVLTAAYVILGGYMATAINDFVQGIIMLGGIGAIIFATLSGKGGFSSAVSQLKEQGSDYASILGPDPINLLGVVLLTSLGAWGLPQMVHKFYAIKDKAAIKKGTIISTLFAAVVAGGSYFLGSFGRLFTTQSEITPDGAAKPVYDVIMPKLLEGLPEVLIGIVVVLVLSASMSTLSSLVMTSSSTLVIDLIKPMRKEEMTEKKQVSLIRIFIAIFVIISIILALNKNTYISTLMSISWGALAGSFLAPFMYGLFSKKITRPAVWASFISGVGITVLHMVLFSLNLFPTLVENVKALSWKINILSPINAGAMAMLLGLIIVPIVSALTKKPDAEHVEKVFLCYKNEK